MGQTQSTPENHIRIYSNLIKIREPTKRVEMIQTLLAGPEFVQSARRAGIYANLLAYVAKVQQNQRPDSLPGEQAPAASQQQYLTVRQEAPRSALATSEPRMQAHYQVSKPRSNEKAINYFQSCLEVLGLEEEVALTEESLKTAYKKAALRAHPDKKGGSDEKFEAVTRSFAYLTEILKRIHGGRTKAGKVEAPTVLNEARDDSAKAWKHVEPVRLNPQKLDMNAFNQMFEQTRIPDPDDDGYGDWLQGQADPQMGAKKFSGKFNRDVFNKMFEEQAAQGLRPSTQLMNIMPQAMTLAPGSGVELGRTKADSYTAPANANLKYTDLKQAYTLENTISPQISHVKVEARDLKHYRASRDRAPEPLTDSEAAAVQESERAAEERERQRQLRVAQEGAFVDKYFERMNRLVLKTSEPVSTQLSLENRGRR